MGRFQKGFTKKYKGSSLYTDVCSVRKYIKKGTHAHRCIEIKEPCMDIMKVLYPYLEEGLQSIPKELLDMLDKIKQMLEENSTNISRESDDDGEGIPIPVKMEEEDKKSQKSKNSDTSEESEHGSKEDGTEEKDSEGKSGSKEDDSESDSKEDGSDSESESEEDEMSDEDFEKDAEKQMENHEKSARDKKESRTGHETDVLDALEQAYEDERELWDLLEEKQDISNKFKISPEKALEGNRFKRFVDRTMKQRSINDRTDQYGGFVNTNQLYKIASGQPNFYCQKGQPYLPDARVYILIDNSGSMGRTKFSEAQKAASVIEEGFKGIVPLKTVCFDTDTEHTEDGNYIRKPDPITGRLNYNDIVRHIIVKDWQDNSRAFNYSETFRQNNHAGGGNKDGYSIRVAATELASYDEQKKLLIVLSDGEPTDYRYVDPYLDTHNAVVQARQMGISVVSIFFGDESYIKSSERVYKAMYEKDYIGVTPDHIQDELQKLLKKII